MCKPLAADLPQEKHIRGNQIEPRLPGEAAALLLQGNRVGDAPTAAMLLLGMRMRRCSFRETAKHMNLPQPPEVCWAVLVQGNREACEPAAAS